MREIIFPAVITFFSLKIRRFLLTLRLTSWLTSLVLAAVLWATIFSFQIPTVKAADQTWNSGGTVTLSAGTYTYDNCVITNNTTVVFNSASAGTTTADPPEVVILNCASLQIDSGSYISADGKGYAGGAVTAHGQGTGYGSYSGNGQNGASGAGHAGSGGIGGRGNTAGGIRYGASLTPATAGSGGGGGTTSTGQSTIGGAGGGIIEINVTGTTTLNGQITADGSAGGSDAAGAPNLIGAGGGAGGSIYLITNYLTGSGTITATGGTGGASYDGNYGAGGGGAGGRVTVEYNTTDISNGTMLSNFLVTAGSGGTNFSDGAKSGGAGVVGSLLVVDNTNNDGYVFSGFDFANDVSYRNLTIMSASKLYIEGDRTFTLTGDMAVTSSTITNVASGDNWTITANSLNFDASTVSLSGDYSTAPLTVTTTGSISLSNNAAMGVGKINWNVGGDLTISSGSYLSTGGRGAAGGNANSAGSGSAGGAAGGGQNGAGGGTYGGSGGTGGRGGAAAGSPTYGSNSNPTDPGSGGGGAGLTGGAGGGVVLVNVTGAFTLNGSLYANGSAGTSDTITGSWSTGAGGSGGSIKVTAGSLSGTTGVLYAYGGAGGNSQDANYGTGGGGGGGRIAVLIYGAIPARFDTGGAGISLAGGVAGTVPSGTNYGTAGSVGTFYSEVLNTAPEVTIDSASQSTDGTQLVTINYTAVDADNNDVSLATYQYSTNSTNGTDGDWSTMTEGAGSDGTSGLSADAGGDAHVFVWDVGTDLAATEDGTVFIRLKLNDGTDDSTTVASSSFAIDTINPTSLDNFALDSTTASSATLSWDAATENNFSHYEIWYGTDSDDVTNRVASEWDDSDDGDLATVGTTGTTITGLAINTYYFKIWAVDDFGNEMTVAAVSGNTNSPPSITIDAVSQDSAGDQLVTVNYTAADADGDDISFDAYQYSLDNSSWSTMTAGAGSDGTSGLSADSGGDAHVFVWDVGTDEPDLEDNTVYVRFTPNDGNVAGTTVTSSAFIIDTANPASLASLSTSPSNQYVDLSWTAATDGNFNHYEIWYGTASNTVTNRTASEWDNSDDTDLATATTATTHLTGLAQGTTYYFQIWAVDDFGNELTTTQVSVQTNKTSSPGGGGSSGSTVTPPVTTPTPPTPPVTPPTPPATIEEIPDSQIESGTGEKVEIIPAPQVPPTPQAPQAQITALVVSNVTTLPKGYYLQTAGQQGLFTSLWTAVASQFIDNSENFRQLDVTVQGVKPANNLSVVVTIQSQPIYLAYGPTTDINWRVSARNLILPVGYHTIKAQLEDETAKTLSLPQNILSFEVGDNLVNYTIDPNKLPPGSLIRAPEQSPRIYIVTFDQKLRYIPNPTILASYYYSNSQVHDVSPSHLALYTQLEALGQGDFLDGYIFKYASSPKVYRLENGAKRWIGDENTFLALGYGFYQIVTLPDSLQFPDGEALR